MKHQKIKIDKELAGLIPPLTDGEYQRLESNIQSDGCRDPLTIWVEKGVLLDGHNRYRICQEHDIRFDVREMNLPDRDAAMWWVILNQFGRRNLMLFQRAELALKLKPLIAEKAKDRQRKGGKEKVVHNCAQAPKTRDELATIAGVSHGTIDKVETILDEATEKDLGELRRGEASINAVYKAIYKEVKRTKKAKAKATVPKDLPSVTERYTIHHGELATVGAKIADVSTDWIITDPPYPKEFLPVFDTLGAFAARTLKPGGSLLCMVGQSYLPDILRALEKHLTYQWTLAYLTPGGQAVQLWDRNVNTFWKPVLWFSRGKYKGDWVGDVCRSDVNDNDKEHHHWGQSESGMADIIERFTYPGQVICDPFGGAMTTGVVAVRMNRLFIGIDIDSEAIRTGLDRLSKLSKTGDGKSTTPH